jgi:hypothetical protein
VIIGGHAFVQDLRRGHYELAAEEPACRRLPVAFDELAMAGRDRAFIRRGPGAMQQRHGAAEAARQARVAGSFS